MVCTDSFAYQLQAVDSNGGRTFGVSCESQISKVLLSAVTLLGNGDDFWVTEGVGSSQ